MDQYYLSPMDFEYRWNLDFFIQWTIFCILIGFYIKEIMIQKFCKEWYFFFFGTPY